MSKKFTGGPAFPQQVQVAADGTTWFDGMTLRDYFAAKSLGSLLNSLALKNLEMTPENIAALAYQRADAMLEARTT
jgi:hypothetical protein